MDDELKKAHCLTLSMRTPTAKLIEEYVVDWAYGTLRERTPGQAPPTPLEREVAKAVDEGLKLGKTRAQIRLPDRRDILEDFKRQLDVIAAGMHPWMAKPVSYFISNKLEEVIGEIEKFQKQSIIDKMVNKLAH